MKLQVTWKNLYQEKALIFLINKHFWKSKIGPIASLFLPLFMMIVYKIIGESNNSLFASGLATYFAFSILPVCLITLPQVIVELKNSIILRKLSVSKITPLKFNLILLSYYLIVLIVSNIAIIILYAIFLNKEAHTYFNLFNWGELIYTLLLVYISSLSLGLLFGVIIKKTTYVQILGFIVMIISVSLSGQFMPLTVLASSDAIRYISLFSPLSYSLNLLNNVLVSTNQDIYLAAINANLFNQDTVNANVIEMLKTHKYNGLFDLKNSFVIFDASWIPSETNPKIKIIGSLSAIKIYDVWQNALDLIMPFFISISFVIISIKKFNWTSR